MKRATIIGLVVAFIMIITMVAFCYQNNIPYLAFWPGYLFGLFFGVIIGVLVYTEEAQQPSHDLIDRIN